MSGLVNEKSRLLRRRLLRSVSEASAAVAFQRDRLERSPSIDSERYRARRLREAEGERYAAIAAAVTAGATLMELVEAGVDVELAMECVL